MAIAVIIFCCHLVSVIAIALIIFRCHLVMIIAVITVLQHSANTLSLEDVSKGSLQKVEN